jgi:hypothetical protein
MLIHGVLRFDFFCFLHFFRVAAEGWFWFNIKQFKVKAEIETVVVDCMSSTTVL